MKETWIKVTDKLPERSGDFLVVYTSGSKYFSIARFTAIDNTFWHKWTERPFRTVTHWQPLLPPSL
jgi:hypothetical protein